MNKRMPAGHKSENLYMRRLPIGQINWEQGHIKGVLRAKILKDKQEIDAYRAECILQLV